MGLTATIVLGLALSLGGCALSATDPPLPRGGLELQGGRDADEDVETLRPYDVSIARDANGFWRADFGEGLELVYVPAGTFTLGADDVGPVPTTDAGSPRFAAHADAGPAHEAWLDGYWIGVAPVTQQQFREFLALSAYQPAAVKRGAHGHHPDRWVYRPDIRPRNVGFGQTEDHPVICVTWEDAQYFLRWVSNRHGLTFDLPTEAQWEKAARGSTASNWPWGDEPPDGTRANFADSHFLEKHALSERADRASPDIDDFWSHTSPVDAYPAGASPYGVLDLAGNTAEWCRDVYDPEAYSRDMHTNPSVTPRLASTPDVQRVVRGGGWSDSAAGPAPSIRSWERHHLRQSSARDDLGFRVVLRYRPFPAAAPEAGQAGPTPIER